MASFEETFTAWLNADLEAKKAAAAPKEVEPKQPEYVTAADLKGMFENFASQVQKALTEHADAVNASVEAVKAEVNEQVEKALPVRAAGAGRVGQEQSADEGEENPVEYLVKKGYTEEGWSEKEKELVTAIVVGAARQGMKY